MTSFDCSNYNQYYSDIISPDGEIDPTKCFKGSKIYPKMRSFNMNNFKSYNSRAYYNFINENMKDYSFPKNYAELSFDDICNQVDYSLKPQQKFAGRAFNTHVENRGILIYHGLGSGKTQTSIVIGEAFKFKGVNNQPIQTESVTGEPFNQRSQKHVLVVVPASLTKQYYSEIIGYLDSDKIKSASGEIVINGERQYYLSKKIRTSLNVLGKQIESIIEKMDSLPEDSQKFQAYQSQLIQFYKQIDFLKEEENKKVSMVYEILSHERFLNQLYDNSSEMFAQGDYLKKLNNPNSLLIIDEAHRLVSATGTSYRKLLFALTFHAHPQFKTVLLSGSPIYDKPFEFGLMMNLLRPRIVFPDGYENFNEIFIDPETKNMVNIDLFRKMTSSYVSYFKGGNPEAYPYKKITIMHHTMDPYQYSIYTDALGKEIEKDRLSTGANNEEFLVKMISSESNNDEVSTSVFNNSRLFCNIAFPEIVVGPEQLKSKKGVRKAVSDAGLTRLRQILFAEAKQAPKNKVKDSVLGKLREFSTKFAKVAELIESSPGPVFIYSNYVTYGVDAMAIIMSAIGYSSFPYSGEPGKSFFIWKGGVDSGDIENARNAFNSPENSDGSKIKIMFGTQSVMEGVDFKAVRQLHILDPWWNDSRLQQIIARGIRLCSHKGVPSSQRVVDVFIHLSTLGSGERLYNVEYNKTIPGRVGIEGPGSSTTEIVKTQSTLIPANPEEPSSNWFYYKSVTFLDKTGNIKEIKELVGEEHKFYANDIVKYSKIIDPQLTRKSGGWKNLDSISVEEYMYSKALKKLYVNRQFEQVIKDCSIDCTLNKYGNIIRLDERYTPIGENMYKLYYENYSTGTTYIRKGVKSKFNSSLQEGVLTLEDILNNTAKNSSSFDFETEDGTKYTINKNLITSEEINCKIDDYSFENIPESIVNLTINKELIKYIMKIPLQKIKAYLKGVEKGTIEVSDKKIITRIRKLYSKEAMSEKQRIIEKLTELGIGDDDTPWDLESYENLKKIYKSITRKNYLI